MEELSTEDFVRSAKSSSEVKVDQSVVINIENCADKGTVIINFSVGRDKVQVSLIFHGAINVGSIDSIKINRPMPY